MRRSVNGWMNCRAAFRAVSQRSVSGLALIGALSIGLSSAALAQDSGQGAQAAHEIVVTGSRISRRDYVADTPIVTVKSDALQSGSQPTIDNALERLPQFSGGNGSSATGQTASNVGANNAGAATLNLRNLGDNRNLVLLDGRRMQPVTDSFAVDINSLPASIIDSVEVITGGASAVYGSDAISGVVNFKLKHNFQGLEVDARGGETGRGDYGNADVSILAGSNLADDKGNVMFAVDYTDRKAVLQRDLPFFQRALAAGTGTWAIPFIGRPYFEPVFGGITNLPDPAIMGAAVGAPGPISPTAVIGLNSDNTTLFTRDNPVYGYNSGVYPNNPLISIGPPGVVKNGNYYNYATTPLERYSVFGRAQYKLTDDITAFAQAIYTHYNNQTRTFAPAASLFWGAFVPRDASHEVGMPAAFSAILDSRASDPGAPWFLERSLDFVGFQEQHGTTQTFQIVTGLNGQFGSDWTWNLSGSHGESSILLKSVQGQASVAKYQQLMALPNYGAGFNDGAGDTCTSGISPFISDVSADCVDYLTVHPKNTVKQKQDIVEGNVQGSVFALPAGDFKVALGADYRSNTYAAGIDDLLLPNPGAGSLGPCPVCSSVIQGFNQVSNAGSISVWELYGEALIPVLRDLPLVKSLDIDLAYRYSDYSLAGGVNTYKADGNWRIADWLMVRAGYERAVRAPNPIELFAAKGSTIDLGGGDACASVGPAVVAYGNVVSNPNQAEVQALCAALVPGSTVSNFTGAFVSSGTPVLTGTSQGNSGLQPETADTITAGLVFSPTGTLPFGANLSASFDYYNIDLSGAIGLLTNGDTYRLCFNANGVSNPTYDPNNAYCKLIIRAPIGGGGTPLSVTNSYQNQGGIKTQGFDFQVDSGLPVGPGTLSLNVVVNYLLDFQKSVVPGAPFYDYADSINASGPAYFRWRSLITPTYTIGPASVGLRWKHMPGARDASCVTSPTSCLKPTASYDLFDLFGGYDLTKDIRFTAGIDNLFNKMPPVVQGTLGDTNVSEYDLVGRTFWAGVHLKF